MQVERLGTAGMGTPAPPICIVSASLPPSRRPLVSGTAAAHAPPCYIGACRCLRNDSCRRRCLQEQILGMLVLLRLCCISSQSSSQLVKFPVLPLMLDLLMLFRNSLRCGPKDSFGWSHTLHAIAIRGPLITPRPVPILCPSACSNVLANARQPVPASSMGSAPSGVAV